MPLTTVSPGMLDTTAQYYGFKSRIINGAMVIDQRNNGAAITVNNNSAWVFATDRFSGIGQPTDGVYTLQRSATAPTGFANSLLATVTTADVSIGSTQFYMMRTTIEGFNASDLMWGTANAQTVTLSFQVRSSLTGTFGGWIRNSAANRSYPYSFTISAANTFEQKTITIPGDTTGTWLTDNGIGIEVGWSLGAGSSRVTTANAWAAGTFDGVTGQTNLISTNGATFYVTGVQLEKGSTATSFDYRPYGTELALCQRYYAVLSATGGSTTVVAYYTQFRSTAAHPVTMRAAPTVTGILSGTTSNLLSGPNWSALNAFCSEMAMSSNAVVGNDFFVRGATAGASAEL